MAQLRKRRTASGTFWQLDWFGPDVDSEGQKVRHQKSLGRIDQVPEKLARDAQKQLERELFMEENGLKPPTVITPTFEEYRRSYLDWHSLEYPDSHYRTRQILEQHIPEAYEGKRLGDWDKETVEELKTLWRRQGFADATVVKHLNTLRGLFTHAADAPKKSGITENPCAKVTWPQVLESKPHLFFEKDELARIYKASREDRHHPAKPQFCPWHAPAWRFLANTGCRRKEAMQLRRKWIRGSALQILSTGEERTKSGKWREIPLFKGAQDALAELDALLGDREFILPRLTLPSMSRAAIKCIGRADLLGSIHTYRHTFISHLALNPSVPVRTIQQYAGHASIRTTELYMYLRDKDRPTELTL